MPLRGRWVASQLSCILILRDESPAPRPSNKASSTILTSKVQKVQVSRLLQLVRVRDSSPALFTLGSAELSQLPQVARIEGHPPHSPHYRGVARPALPLLLPWGQLSHTTVSRASSILLSSQGAEPAFLKAAAGERLGQFSRPLQEVRSRASCAQLLDTHVVPRSCLNQGHHHVL